MIHPDAGIADALRHGQLISITTTGRRTGRPRRVALAFHNVDGHIVISGRPGFARDWIANLNASPELTFHLERGVRADLPARGRVITRREERERYLGPIARLWRIDPELMIRAAPLVEVTFD